MSDENKTLKQWIEEFDNRKFESSDVRVQCEAGWYDWFCKDETLVKKTHSLAPKVKKIANSEKVNVNTMYVLFKNNCPMSGPLYDDFRICDIETGNVIWTITPKSGHTGLAEVWGKENDFESELASGKMTDIYAYFGV